MNIKFIFIILHNETSIFTFLQLRAAKKERRKRKEGRQEKRERGRRHAIAAENEGPVERWKDSVALMYEKQMLRKPSGIGEPKRIVRVHKTYSTEAKKLYSKNCYSPYIRHR